MKTSLFMNLALATLLIVALTPVVASAEMSLGAVPNGTMGTLGSPMTTSAPVVQTTTTAPQAGTSAGSSQMAGPLDAAPNGAGGTYGNPNAAIDPNTTNPGLPQPTYYSSPATNYGKPFYGEGTVSGTTTSINPATAPFVTPPAMAAPGTVPNINQ